MTAVEIATSIVSVLLVASRWLQSLKPMWSYLPKAVATLLPSIVLLVPQVADLLNQTKSWTDLINYVAAAFAITVAGLFPQHGTDTTAS